MATLPTVPTFSNGDHSLTNLENLAQAVSFLSSCDVRPQWEYYMTGTQSITANTWTTAALTTVAADSDGTFTSATHLATIVTQGYYYTTLCLGVQAGGAVDSTAARFAVTAGTHNPNHASSAQVFYNDTASLAPDTASVDATWAFSGQCPWVLYPGDTIAAQIWSDTTISIQVPNATNFMKGRFAPTFSGYWVRPGTNEATDT